jgi:hypothetical protein
MQLNIIPKKPFTDYSPEEQQAILARGESLQLCKQGDKRTKEDTFCMTAFLQSKRNVSFRPTVEKVVKEKALTKAQKLELLNESIGLTEEQLSDKHKLVIEELVGVDKEYYVFTLPDGSKELMKMTKTNIKKKVKELNNVLIFDLLPNGKILTTSEQEFLTAMTGEITK